MLRRGNFFDKSSGALALKQELSMYMYIPYVCACAYCVFTRVQVIGYNQRVNMYFDTYIEVCTCAHPLSRARTELGFRESWTGWIPPSPLVQINLYQGEILPYNTELVGQAFGSLVGWIVREDRSSAFQSERGQVHRPTEQILLGNQVHLYRGNFIVQASKFCLVIRFVPGGADLAPNE